MEEYFKDLDKKLSERKEKIEKIPAEIKRCPKCKKLTLEFDPEQGRIHCTSCGLEYYLKKAGD